MAHAGDKCTLALVSRVATSAKSMLCHASGQVATVRKRLVLRCRMSLLTAAASRRTAAHPSQAEAAHPAAHLSRGAPGLGARHRVCGWGA